MLELGPQFLRSSFPSGIQGSIDRSAFTIAASASFGNVLPAEIGAFGRSSDSAMTRSPCASYFHATTSFTAPAS